MFEDMKLGTKIAAGYAGVLLVTSAVTAFTLFQVNTQAGAANELAQETAPQVQIACFGMMPIRSFLLWSMDCHCRKCNWY